MLSLRFGRLPMLLLAAAVTVCVSSTARAGARVVVYPQVRTAYVGGFAPRCGLGYGGRVSIGYPGRCIASIGYGYGGRCFPSYGYGYGGRYYGGLGYGYGYGGRCLPAYNYLAAYGYAGRYVPAYGYIVGYRPLPYGYGLAPRVHYTPVNTVYLYGRVDPLVRTGYGGSVSGSLVPIR